MDRHFGTAGVVWFMLLTCIAVGTDAQPITWSTSGVEHIGGTGTLDADEFDPACSTFGDTRYLYLEASTTRTTGISHLIIGINVDESKYAQLPYQMTANGHPAGSDPPSGIEPFVGGSPCWWSGSPVYSWDSGITDAVTNSPVNPIPGIGTWRAFAMQLEGDSLAGSEHNISLEPYFRFRSNETGFDVLESINGMVCGVITTGPSPLGNEAAIAGTTFYFDAPVRVVWEDAHKMHFPQYPDTFGLDIDFTFPKLPERRSAPGCWHSFQANAFTGKASLDAGGQDNTLGIRT